MTPAHWLANLSPDFSVHDLEVFNSSAGPVRPDPNLLRALGLTRAAFWLERHERAWNDHLRAVEKALKFEEKGEFQIIFWGQEYYPKSLATLSFPPSVLLVRGDVRSLHQTCIAVVGARHPTDLGRLWVEAHVPELVRENLTIVSGGARGIDAYAHEAALNAGGRTVAFLPGGVDSPYPRSNRWLFDRLTEKGALVSEFLPETRVRPENFHRRNRLIAGAGSSVVIVEAGLKSGTIMTASKATAENRDLLVVPGPPMVASYAGSLELLFQGAGLARDAKDVVNSLKLGGHGPRGPHKPEEMF